MTDLTDPIDEISAQLERDRQMLAMWPELVRQLDRANDLLSVCDLDAPSDVADIEEIRDTISRARALTRPSRETWAAFFVLTPPGGRAAARGQTTASDRPA